MTISSRGVTPDLGDVDTPSGYTVRPYRRADKPDLLSLFQHVLDEEMTEPWFEWKYENNPYTTEIPLIVATYRDQVIGTLAVWPLVLHTGEGGIQVVQSCDGAVAPEHRRKGIYTAMFRAGLEYATATGARFVFDFPNEASKATFEKFGWELVEKREHLFRVQDPIPLVETRYGIQAPPFLRSGSRWLTRAYLGRRLSQQQREQGRIEVEGYPSVPSKTMAEIYEHSVPSRFHLLRDERFFEWRFDNPHWNYTTYIARFEGTPVAGVIAGTKTNQGLQTTALTDVLPLSVDAERSAITSLIALAVDDHSDSDLIAAPASVIPTSARTSHRFKDNRTFPFSLIANPVYHGVCPLGTQSDDAWIVDGKHIADSNSWQITFAEYDTR